MGVIVFFVSSQPDNVTKIKRVKRSKKLLVHLGLGLIHEKSNDQGFTKSFFLQFQFKKDGSVKLRCKKLPQDLEWKPPTGIQLIKNDIDFVPVPAEQFRVEDLKLYEIFKSLNRYLGTMGNDEKLKVSKSSDAVGDDRKN